MRIKSFFLCLSFVLCFIVGCGKTPNLGSQSYIGAASIGDLVSIDLDGNKFSIKGVAGKLEGKTLSGTLAFKEGFSDHVFTSPEYPNFTLVMTPEALAYQYGDFGKFVVGVPRARQTYDASKIAKIYNYVSQSGLTVNYGTFSMTSENKWYVWRKKNGKDVGPKRADFSGHFKDSGQGYLIATMESGEVFAHLMLNDGGLLIIDLVALDGIAVGAPQKSINPLGAYKAYDVISPAVDKLYTADISGDKIKVLGETKVIKYNYPWEGFLSEPKRFTGSGFKGIVSPDQRTFFGVDRLFDLGGAAPGVIFTAIGKK